VVVSDLFPVGYRRFIGALQSLVFGTSHTWV
jgi:hypothetical protein